MTRQQFKVGVAIGVWMCVLGLKIAAQDRSTLKVPGGLAFSEFKGYEAWQVIAPSETDNGTKAIVGNPVMINAYRSGFPGNGKPAPDGAMIAKIEWSKQSNAVSPYAVTVPDKLLSLAFMVKDSKRFPNSGGWGWAKFDSDSSAAGFKPIGTGATCGYECHTRVKARDFVFTSYPPR
jgi:hypothetical protein